MEAVDVTVAPSSILSTERVGRRYGRSSDEMTKRRRYFSEFRTAIRANGYNHGDNDGAELTTDAGRTRASLQQHSELIFSIPFTHGYIKRAYFCFRLLGSNVPALKACLVTRKF